MLKIKTIIHAKSWAPATPIKTKSLFIKTAYKVVKNIVVVQVTYVGIFALGFLFQRSIIVGIKPAKVTIPQIP